MKTKKKLKINVILITILSLFINVSTVLAQKKVTYTKGIGIPHQSFEEDFLTHKKGNEWWYATGYLEDEQKNMFAFQYTLVTTKVMGMRVHLLLTSLTDMETEKHYYSEQKSMFKKGVITNANETSFKDIASIKYEPNDICSFGKMNLNMKDDLYSLQLKMDAQKAPVWNCDKGILQMGILDDPKQVTYYYSITNMLAEGTIILDGVEHKVKGKAWFDKQGGTYDMRNPLTNWEWFSFRFFDNEEIMLFSFPQDDYVDGTYIKVDGSYERLNNYEVTATSLFVEPTTQKTFSNEWLVKMPGIKGEEYIVKPRVDGQFNLAFYELLADVFDKNGNLVGYCYVELLPGARNQ